MRTARLRLGASATLARYILPRLLAAFERQFPAISVTLQPLNSVQVAAALEQAELELGFVESTARLPHLRYEHLLFDEIIAVRRAAPGGPPASPVALAETLACPLVLSESGSGMLDVVETTLRQHGVRLADLPTPPEHFVAHEDIKARVLALPGSLGFITRRGVTAELLNGQLEEVPIRGLLLARELLAAWRADTGLTEEAQLFLTLCRDYYQSP